VSQTLPETLVFDVETQLLSDDVGGWNRIRDMRLAAAVVYGVEKNEYTSYQEPDVTWLVERLCSARLVIGYNLMRFDYEVLMAYTDRNLRALPTLDIMLHLQRHLGFRPRLADVTAATLGEGKTADGVQSVRWFQAGEIDRVIEYCAEDVRLTYRLYSYGLEHGHVLVRDGYRGVVRVPVNWA
jgi:DEAD/DEAH box helicase domain-containing protein